MRGAVAQYRQSVPTDSLHLYVWTDGTWSIGHVDAFNPDSRPLAHFVDTLPGRMVTRAQVRGPASKENNERLAARLKGPPITPELRCDRQIGAKLEPQLTDLRARSQRIQGIQQK